MKMRNGQFDDGNLELSEGQLEDIQTEIVEKDSWSNWDFEKATEDVGIAFQVFSLGHRDGSLWSPLKNAQALAANQQAAANAIARGLRLEHTDDAGRTFWSRASGEDVNEPFEIGSPSESGPEQ